ncbi:gp16 family protein [Bowmanella denitrificans]|uniref:gp16 family protein n=1 Tax=Bowmanella denitrificans TaxID=366582 RepID=UPI000C9A57AA|nr:regulatory protein GemA [Bowmanella denitrificans]
MQHNKAIQDARKRLIAKVHVGKAKLGLDDDTYRAMLVQITGHNSAAALRPKQLHDVLEHMQSKGFKPSKTGQRRQSPKSGNSRLAEVDKIRAIWIDMARQGFVRDGSEAALDAWIKRQTAKANNGVGVESVAWQSGGMALSNLESIKAWHKRLMAKQLIAKGITHLVGYKQRMWSTSQAPYDYVSAAYHGHIEGQGAKP